MKREIKLYEVEHSYYANVSGEKHNFEYNSFGEFLGKNSPPCCEETTEFLDKDYNWLIRWDYLNASEEEERETDELILVYFLQRRGVFGRHIIKVSKKDEPAIRKFLKDYYLYFLKMWSPFSEIEINREYNDEIKRTKAKYNRKKFTVLKLILKLIKREKIVYNIYDLANYDNKSEAEYGDKYQENNILQLT